MGQIVFWILAIIVFILFRKVPKVMNVMEMAACWMFAIVFLQDWVIIVVIHLKQFKILNHAEWTIAMNRTFLFPAFTIIFLNYFFAARSFFKKFLWFIGWFGLTLTAEYLNDWVGIFKHKDWPIGRSVFLWMLLWFLLLGVKGLMAALIRRGKAEVIPTVE